MNRKAFSQLLKEYLNNTCTEEERRIVDQWYELLDNGNEAFADVDFDKLETNLWKKIQISTNEKNTEASPRVKKNILLKYAAAACLVGVISLVGLAVFQNKNKKASDESIITAKLQQGFLEETNNGNTARNIKLDDGSCLTIYPGAKLVFPKHFAADKREVYLDGDAFFQVSKNPNRPFFVYSDHIVTQVLGTSFAIHKKDQQVEVDVKTGRVAVYEDEEHILNDKDKQKSNGVIITPNQKVVYYQQERHFVTSIVDQPMAVEKAVDDKTGEITFNYSDTPLCKVLQDLESTYGLEIVLENEKLKNCLFTGDLHGQSMFNQLQSICLVFNSTYEIKGTKILLKGGKNCS
jgi:ferric-dicitrate binding protein FerR (iron transport regulator)